MIQVADGRKLYAAPDDDTTQAFLDYVGTAKTRVTICDYSFNLVQLCDLFKPLNAAGVDITLTLDRSQSKGKSEVVALDELKAEGLTPVIGTSDKHQIMHDKFVVVDDSVLYGSWNFTESASKEDNFFVIDPSEVVTQWFVGVAAKIRTWIISNEPQPGVISAGS